MGGGGGTTKPKMNTSQYAKTSFILFAIDRTITCSVVDFNDNATSLTYEIFVQKKVSPGNLYFNTTGQHMLHFML